MKRILFLAVITSFLSFSVNAQTKEVPPVVNNCPPCPTIMCPVVQQPIPIKKTYRRAVEKTPSVVTTITNSGNTTINNHYPIQGGFAVEKTFSVSDWVAVVGVFTIFLIILLLRLFMLLDWYRSKHLNVSNRQNSNAPIVNVYPPSAPAPTPIVVVPISEAEIDKAMNAAKKEGFTFSRTNNGYDIHFLPSKNTEKPASDKKEEQK